MKIWTLPVVVVCVLGAIILFNSAFVVYEWEQVVVTQFGRPIGDPVTEPGLR